MPESYTKAPIKSKSITSPKKPIRLPLVKANTYLRSSDQLSSTAIARRTLITNKNIISDQENSGTIIHYSSF